MKKSESSRNAVIHFIKIIKQKNLDVLIKTKDGEFIHKNKRECKRFFTPYSINEFFKRSKSDAAFRKMKLHKVKTLLSLNQKNDTWRGYHNRHK